jgi:predicted NUDIX family NTP pyrophosphohydrolase
MYRRAERGVELLLVHFGGPMWAKKDGGAWSFPKGEIEADEDALTAARREFEEELGVAVDGAFVALEPVKQKGGKVVELFAVEGDLDVGALRGNTFTMEWPPRSGRRADFPEVDRAAWFGLEEARRKLLPSLLPVLDDVPIRLFVPPGAQ